MQDMSLWRSRPRKDRRAQATEAINKLAPRFHVVWLTPYQARVNDVIDLYPTNLRYHNLRTGNRRTFPIDGLALFITARLKETP